jgi:tetratricopeptide (TPR) repeat protein
MKGMLLIGRSYQAQQREEKGVEYTRRSIEVLDESLRLDPRNTNGLVYRGWSHKCFGHALEAQGEDPLPSFERALRDFSEVLRIQPANPNAWFNRGNAHATIAAVRKGRGEDPTAAYGDALHGFSVAVTQDPTFSTAFSNRANARLGFGDWLVKAGREGRPEYRQAVADCRAAVEVQETNYRAWNTMGNAVWSLADTLPLWEGDALPVYEEALACFAKALAVEPGLWPAHGNAGSIQFNLARFDDAAASFEAAVQLTGGRKADLQDNLKKSRHYARQGWHGLNMKALGEGKGTKPNLAAILFELAVERARASGAEKNPFTRRLFATSHFLLARIYATASAGKKTSADDPAAVAQERKAELRKRAFANLAAAMELGHRQLDNMREDPGLAPLRDDPAFEALLAKWK